jgi:hypothetical protein
MMLTVDEYMSLRRLIDSERESEGAKRAIATETPKKKRKVSAYSKKYGKAFKKVAPKYKKKNGGWKAGGFKAAQKAAHKMAKRMR